MKSYVALLRAVNVGGTGKLPMGDLRAICERLGLGRVQTYIASGNVVFLADATEAEVRATLEAALAEYADRPVGVLVRSAREMADIVAQNPFPTAPGDRTVAVFLAERPDPAALLGLVGQTDEEVRLGAREVYIHYPSGQGRSRLRVPAAATGTARNLNTVARLAALAAEREG